MPDDRDDDLRLASALSEDLVHQVEAASDRPRATYPQGTPSPSDESVSSISLPPSDIFTADVEMAFERFAEQYRTLRTVGQSFFGLEGRSGRIPFDVDVPQALFAGGGRGRLGTARPRPWSGPIYEQWRRRVTITLSSIADRYGRVISISPSEALDLVGSGVREFLAVRFSARQSNISQAPGLRFEVSTQTSGLRIHFSPAYFLNTRTVFGSPSTPVRQWIQPGRYVFGAVGPSTPLQFDLDSHYDIPPQDQAHLYL
jgi:hypothetical protein